MPNYSSPGEFKKVVEFRQIVCEYRTQCRLFANNVCEFCQVVLRIQAGCLQIPQAVCEFIQVVCEYRRLQNNVCEIRQVVCEFRQAVCEFNLDGQFRPKSEPHCSTCGVVSAGCCELPQAAEISWYMAPQAAKS